MAIASSRHAVKSGMGSPANSGNHCSKAAVMSLCSAASTLTNLLNSQSSMSMCTIRASGANQASLPVTRSSKRIPIATIRSH
jgi:hypothetical protein